MLAFGNGETTAFASAERFVSADEILFLGALPHPALPPLTSWQPLKPLADQCNAAGMPLTNSPTGKFPVVLFLPGKSKEETLAGFAIAHDLLAPGGQLITSLVNTSGASRYEKELAKATPIHSSISKHKCRAFTVSTAAPWKPEVLRQWRNLAIPSLIPDTDFLTQPGIFSAKHIDPGSAFLAEHLPKDLSGQLADLGAGWGYLSHEALRKSPKISQIDLFEADARALFCARHNVPEKSSFHWHDATTPLPRSYDHIISNPPFHTAQKTDTDLGKSFLSTAANSLKRSGTLYLVANRQLPYEAHLVSLGLRPRIVAENHTYKVIFARR